MEIYNEMLKEYCGIDLNRKEVSVDLSQVNIPVEIIDCCPVPALQDGPRAENAYCVNCGLCVKNPFYQIDYKRMQSSITVTKKRFYSPLTHFKEHLRRYMGHRLTYIPEFVVEGTKEVDVKDPQAFTLMKQRLKELGKPKLYKEVFLLIYMHGGVKPDISPQLYYKCIEDFKAMQYTFLKNRDRWIRHSMPSNYMILKKILDRNNHQPYYDLPILKNERCKTQVSTIYDFLEEILNSAEYRSLP